VQYGSHARTLRSTSWRSTNLYLRRGHEGGRNGAGTCGNGAGTARERCARRWGRKRGFARRGGGREGRRGEGDGGRGTDGVRERCHNAQEAGGGQSVGLAAHIGVGLVSAGRSVGSGRGGCLPAALVRETTRAAPLHCTTATALHHCTALHCACVSRGRQEHRR
jgi:hypothetical protein